MAGTFAALAARYPDAGGVATFVRLALGPTAARATGYWFFFGVNFGVPVLAALGGGYLVAALGLDQGWVAPIGFGFLAPADHPQLLRPEGERAACSWSSRRCWWSSWSASSRRAVPAVRVAHFTPFLPHGWAGVGLAISLFVWAFAGWEAVTHIAGEFRNPRRTIPLATAIAVAVVGIAYLALQFATVGVLGTSRRQRGSADRPGLGHPARVRARSWSP